MAGSEYPKIETLFNRGEDHKVTAGYRMPEFGLVSKWLVTEKIDGTNVRVFVDTRGIESIPVTGFRGRTDAAQMPPFLADELRRLFPDDRVGAAFDEGTQAVLFGEGYGARIQKGGGNYRDGISFRLFDVAVTGTDGFIWWLNWSDVEDVARKLGIKTVPSFSVTQLEHIVKLVKNGLDSAVAYAERGHVTPAEGVVCRTEPLLFTRRGHRLTWKLKTKDF